MYKKGAYTLIELLIIIAIIGLISTLSALVFGPLRSKSRDAKRINDLKAIQMAMEMYKDNDSMQRPTTSVEALGVYIRGGFPKPTGNKLYYICTGRVFQKIDNTKKYIIMADLENSHAKNILDTDYKIDMTYNPCISIGVQSEGASMSGPFKTSSVDNRASESTSCSLDNIYCIGGE